MILRPPDERDLEAIDEGIRDPDVVRWIGATTGSASDVLALNRARWRDGSPTFSVCEKDDRCVGHVWLNVSVRDREQASVGYWLLPAARGHGLATCAVRLMVPWAIEALGLRQVRLVTDSANDRSQRVAERSGFVPSGTEVGRSSVDGRAFEHIVYAWSAEEAARA